MIYPGKRDKNNLKILIVGEYVGEKVELAQDFSYGVTKAIQFLNMNPIGKVRSLASNSLTLLVNVLM